jgi:signal transduction histidine kinase
MTPLHLNPYTTEREYRQLVEGLVSGDADSVFRQATLLRKDGTEVPVEKTLRSAPTGRDGTRWVITLMRDISARLAAEAELRASQAALQEAERSVAVAEDRDRIARDLHDTVIQRLFAEGLNLQAVLGVLQDPSRARARIEATIDALDATIKDLRTAIFALQRVQDAGVGGVRGRLLDVVVEASSALGFEPRLQFDGAIEAIDDVLVDELVPVLREALSNVAQHARASHARVSVAATQGEVVLTVADDGAGVPDEVIGGRGVTNMGERARSSGGELTLERRPEGGTTLVWRVPNPR